MYVCLKIICIQFSASLPSPFFTRIFTPFFAQYTNMQNYQIGKTKLFLRYYHMERMEIALKKFYQDVVWVSWWRK